MHTYLKVNTKRSKHTNTKYNKLNLTKSHVQPAENTPSA